MKYYVLYTYIHLDIPSSREIFQKVQSYLTMAQILQKPGTYHSFETQGPIVRGGGFTVVEPLQRSVGENAESKTFEGQLLKHVKNHYSHKGKTLFYLHEQIPTVHSTTKERSPAAIDMYSLSVYLSIAAELRSLVVYVIYMCGFGVKGHKSFF